MVKENGILEFTCELKDGLPGGKIGYELFMFMS